MIKDQLPDPLVYEMNEVDERFLKELNESKSKSKDFTTPIVDKYKLIQMIVAFEKEAALHDDNSYKINCTQAENISKQQKIIQHKSTIQKIYKYWTEQRKHLKRPLLRKFWRLRISEQNLTATVFN